jgi:hypothetical protein
MPVPISLPSQGARSTPLAIPRAQDPLSILTAIPLLPEPDQEWALAHWSDRKTSDPDAAKLRREVRGAIMTSLDGMTVKSRHWSGTRADNERSAGINIDQDLVASGLVRRLTARLPVGPSMKSWMKTSEQGNLNDQTRSATFRTRRTYLHAKGRAKYQIGEGLKQAAKALLPFGLLEEAKPLRGSGRNRPERLMIRDAILAAEDITIEDMARILVNAPYKMDEARGARYPLWEEDRVATEKTPLLFIQCRGIERPRHGPSEVILEAVDFQSIETMERCLSVMRDKDQRIHEEARDMLMDAFPAPINTRRRGRRRFR